MNTQIFLNGITVDELIARIKTEIAPAAPATAITSDPDFLTVKEVSKLLGVSQVTIHQWKKDGKLRFHRFGSRVRFLRSDVLDKEKYQPGHKA